MATDEYKAAVAGYERQRHDLHAAVGRVWAAVQVYGDLLGKQPPEFNEQGFNSINVPTLIPNTNPWGNPYGACTTTQASTMGWFNPTTHRKSWPAA